MINPVNPVNPVKRNFYREIARYPLTTADETIDIDKRLEKGESVEFALDCEKEVSALNVWRGEREKPLDPFDGPRDYGCTLKVEAFDGAAWHAVGDVRCPALRSFTSRPTIRRSRWVRSARASTAPTAHHPRCGRLPTTSSKGRSFRQGQAPPLAVFFAPCRGSRPCRVAEHIREMRLGAESRSGCDFGKRVVGVAQ